MEGADSSSISAPDLADSARDARRAANGLTMKHKQMSINGRLMGIFDVRVDHFRVTPVCVSPWVDEGA